MIAISLLLFLLLVVNIHIRFKLSLVRSSLVAPLSIIIFLYIAGMAGSLKIGVYVLIGVIIVFTILNIIQFKHFRESYCKIVKNPVLYTLVGFLVLSAVLSIGKRPIGWDEFSHWALIVKNMKFFNNFGNMVNTNTICNGYPPAVGLFLYFISFFDASFMESSLYTGFYILQFSIMLQFVGFIEEGFSFKKVLALLVIFVTPLVIFEWVFVFSLYIDAYLGMMFACVLFIYFTEKDSKTKLVLLSLISFVMVTSKESGLGLILLAYLIMLVDWLVVERKATNYKFTKRSIFYIFPALAVFVGKLSWKLYLKINNIPKAWGSVTFENIKQLFHLSDYPSLIEVTKSFWKTFLLRDFIFILALVGAIVLFMLLFNNKKVTTRCKTLVISLVLSVVIYAISLWLLYLFTFSEVESVVLASYHRYMNTIILGVLLLLLGLGAIKYLNFNYNCSNIGKIVFKVVVFVLGCVMAVSYLSVFLYRVDVAKIQYSEFEKFDVFCDNLDYDTDRVLFIMGKMKHEWRKGIEYHYYATPILTNNWGKTYYLADKRDTDAVEYSVSEMKNYISGFTYVYFSCYDDYFVQDYGELFYDTEGVGEQYKMYKVVYEDGNLKLKVVESF